MKEIQRTYLFVPAISERKLTKAIQSEADSLIFDLEDSIEYHQKKEARNVLRGFFQPPPSSKYQVIRINSVGDEHYYDDLLLALELKVDAIMLPKAEKVSQIKRINQIIKDFEKNNKLKCKTAIIPLIETAEGLHSALSILKSSNRITRLAFGGIDFAHDLGINTPHDTLLQHVKTNLSVYSKIARKQKPIDTVFPDVEDTAGLKEEAEAAKGLGFYGKMVIHPNQINIVNAVFTSSKEELLQATQIVTEYENALKGGIGAIKVYGKMIDAPIYKQAKDILRRHKHID